MQKHYVNGIDVGLFIRKGLSFMTLCSFLLFISIGVAFANDSHSSSNNDFMQSGVTVSGTP